MVGLTSGINSSRIWILTTRGVWSEECCNSGRIEWLSSSEEFGLRNIKSMTKFELPLLSEYLVETRLVGYEKDKSKVLVMLKSKLLWTEWKK